MSFFLWDFDMKRKLVIYLYNKRGSKTKYISDLVFLMWDVVFFFFFFFFLANLDVN